MKNIAILFLGLSASGKGKRCKLLQRSGQNWKYLFGSGEYIRSQIKADTELGQAAEKICRAGKHLSDDLIQTVWHQGLKPLEGKPLILDGCVRNAEQARRFLLFMRAMNYIVHVVIVDTPLSVCLGRVEKEIIDDPARSEREDTENLTSKITGDLNGFRGACGFFFGTSGKLSGRNLRLKGIDFDQDLKDLQSWIAYLMSMRLVSLKESAA